MFRTPLLRVQQTASHFLKSTTSSTTSLTSRAYSGTSPLKQNTDTMADRPNGLIAKSGLELLTFGTPNGNKAATLTTNLADRLQATKQASSSRSLKKPTDRPTTSTSPSTSLRTFRKRSGSQTRVRMDAYPCWSTTMPVV